MTALGQVQDVDPRAMREVLGRYPTGVAVITAMADDGRPVAMTVGTFTSVSLDPPLVGFLPARDSKSFARLRTSDSFCVNVLAAGQEVLCRAFASAIEDKFAGVAWEPTPSGSPIIKGSVAWIDADFEQITEVGDHYFVVGRVRHLGTEADELPLLFFERGYGRFAPLQFVARSPSRLIPVMRAVEAARPILEGAAEDTEVEIVVTVAMDDQMVQVAALGSKSMHPSAVVGRRLPLAPPIGSLFVMDDETERDAWIDRSSRGGDAEDRQRLLGQLERVREQGWVLSRTSPRHEELDVMLDAIAHDVHTPAQGRRLLELLDELRDAYDGSLADHSTLPVRMLAVPVRNESGQVVLQLGVPDLDTEGGEARIAAVRSRLLKSAEELAALPAVQRLVVGGHDR